MNLLLKVSCFFHDLQVNVLLTKKHHHHYHQLLQRWGYGVVRILWSSSNWIFFVSSKTHKNKSHCAHNINNFIENGNTAWDTQRKSKFIDKQIYSKSFYGSDILSETYPPLSAIPKHLEFTQLHLPS